MTRLTLLALAAAALVAAGCGDDDGDASASNTDGPAMKSDAAMKSDTAMQSDTAMASKRKGAVVKVVSSDYGRVIADKKGEAFYLFDKEQGKKSQCYGECAVAWPPVLTKGKPRAGKGAKKNLLGTTKRRNGRLQVTYAGHPLYYYKTTPPAPSSATTSTSSVGCGWSSSPTATRRAEQPAQLASSTAVLSGQEYVARN
jgi:predicted lipoprotein with Yx(FWY)xxD motif